MLGFISLFLFVFAFQIWTDEFLTWKPEDYGGIRAISMPPSYVWTPDIELYNRHIMSFHHSVSFVRLTRFYLAAGRQGRSSCVEALRGNCLLVMWPVILHVTHSHKRTKDVVTRHVFKSPNAFGGRAPPQSAGGA